MGNEVMVPGYSDIAIKEDGGLQFAKVGQVQSFAVELDKNHMLPKNMDAGQATIAILFGMKMGIDPLAAVQNIAVINGRPCVWGDACGAICQALIEDEFLEEVGHGEEYKAVYHVKRKGRSREMTREFGFQDAKRAGLWGKPGPWTQYPKRMMMIRARAFAYRDAFPDLLKGIRIVEEENDTPIDITDKAQVSPAPYADPNAAPKGRKASAGTLLKAAAGQPKPQGEQPKAGEGEAAAPAEKTPETPAAGGEDPKGIFKQPKKEKVPVKAQPEGEAAAGAELPLG